MSYQHWQNSVTDLEAIVFPDPFSNGRFGVSINNCRAETDDSSGVWSYSLFTVWGASREYALELAEKFGPYWDLHVEKIKTIAAWRTNGKILRFFPTGECWLTLNIHTSEGIFPSCGSGNPRTVFRIHEGTKLDKRTVDYILHDLKSGRLGKLVEPRII